jgi:hypothetical protein
MRQSTQFSHYFGSGLERNTIQLLGETVLCLIALLFTVVEVSYRVVGFIFKNTAGLFLQFVWSVLLAALFILGYFILMGIYLAVSP